MDWHSWHADYDVPDSWPARRLAVVQEQVPRALDASPPGPLTVVSLCAGEGRDLLEVLPTHPRRDDVRARLVELDPRSTAVAEESIRVAGLTGVEVVEGDAALVDHYQVWLSDPEAGFGVGSHRLTGRPEPLIRARSMFVFASFEQLGGK